MAAPACNISRRVIGLFFIQRQFCSKRLTGGLLIEDYPEQAVRSGLFSSSPPPAGDNLKMHAYLFPGLQAGPLTIRNLIRKIPADRMDRPTHPGRFTPREIVAHLSDWEPISRGRMQTAVATPGVGVPGIDELERAKEQGYGGWNPIEQADNFIQRRSETIAFLKGIGSDDWKSVAVHSERGAMSVYDYANMELGHDLYHITQLCAVLGKVVQ